MFPHKPLAARHMKEQGKAQKKHTQFVVNVPPPTTEKVFPLSMWVFLWLQQFPHSLALVQIMAAGVTGLRLRGDFIHHP